MIQKMCSLTYLQSKDFKLQNGSRSFQIHRKSKSAPSLMRHASNYISYHSYHFYQLYFHIMTNATNQWTCAEFWCLSNELGPHLVDMLDASKSHYACTGFVSFHSQKKIRCYWPIIKACWEQVMAHIGLYQIQLLQFCRTRKIIRQVLYPVNVWIPRYQHNFFTLTFWAYIALFFSWSILPINRISEEPLYK